MSPRRLAISSLALVLAVVLALGACSLVPYDPPPLRQVTLLLGFRPDVQFAPFYLAQQDGLYADAGLEVTIEHDDDVVRLVADGQAEFGVADATDVMIARTAGIPVKYVSTLYDHFPVALMGAPDVMPAVPSELAGLRIGTPGHFGSSWHALLALLESAGLTTGEVTIREYPAFNQVEGLLNGDVDLITGFRNNEPLQLEARGMEVELLTVDEIAPLPGPGVVVGDELLASDPDLVAGFAQATLRAQQSIANDPGVGFQAAVAEIPVLGEDDQTARAVLEATIELWLGPGGEPSGGINLDAWVSGYRIMRTLGFIDGSVPREEMYEPQVIREG